MQRIVFAKFSQEKCDNISILVMNYDFIFGTKEHQYKSILIAKCLFLTHICKKIYAKKFWSYKIIFSRKSDKVQLSN